MKFQLAINVMSFSKEPYHFTPLAQSHEPYLQFERLEDPVAYLDRIAEATGDEKIRQFAAAVKREGAVAERMVRGWGRSLRRSTWRS